MFRKSPSSDSKRQKPCFHLRCANPRGWSSQGSRHIMRTPSGVPLASRQTHSVFGAMRVSFFTVLVTTVREVLVASEHCLRSVHALTSDGRKPRRTFCQSGHHSCHREECQRQQQQLSHLGGQRCCLPSSHELILLSPWKEAGESMGRAPSTHHGPHAHKHMRYWRGIS